MRALAGVTVFAALASCSVPLEQDAAETLFLSPPPSPSPSAEPLRRALEARLEGFRGDVGVYVRHLDTAAEVAIRADEIFPTASLIKVPILLGLFARIDAGEIGYRDALVYEAKRKYPGEDLLASFEDGATIHVAQLAMLMTAFSDNTASLWCQELAGGGSVINRWLAEHGCVSTRVNSYTEGREAAQKELGWGQTTPREMAELLVAIGERRAISAAASDEMHRLLSRSYWASEALSQLPPDIAVASKQGAVDASRSEALLVHAPHGDYVLCVITKNQKDESWEHANEGHVLVRDVSRLVFEHLEPDWGWKPAEGSDRFR